MSSHNQKVGDSISSRGKYLGCGFGPQSWHSTLVQAPMGGSRSMILSCIDISLPSSLSKSNEKMSSGEKRKKKLKKIMVGQRMHYKELDTSF